MSSSRSFVNPNQKYERVVVLVDMDCFFCQVEEKLNPELKGKPVAVVQYNNWNVSGGGGIIAVNYIARDMGVTRHMRGDEAREKCPEVELVKVPNHREKPDTSRYRDAGKEVADVLQTFTTLLERASVDEAYLDITEEVQKRMDNITKGDGQVDPNLLVNTFAVGYEHIGDFIREILTSISNNGEDEAESYEDGLDSSTIRKSNFKLLVGATIAGEMRSKIKEVTGYECSAGVAHNKVLAKLVCGMNKPNKQTVLPLKEIPSFFKTLPVGKIKGLGGKFGEDICEMLKIKHLGDLGKFSEEELQRRFTERNGSWLYQICRGIDLECVTPRYYSKSIGCCKRFPGRNAITGYNTLKHWITELVTEIVERLEKDVEENNRQPKQSVISFTLEINGEDVAQTRSISITSIDQESLEQVMTEVLKKNIDPFFKKNEAAGLLNFPIKFLGISAGKFVSIEKKTVTLETMFAKQALKASTTAVKDVKVSSAQENTLTQENKKILKENLLEKMFEKQALKATLKDEDISFAPGCSSTQENKSLVLEKQSEDFKEKPTEEVNSKGKPSFFKNFFIKSKNDEKVDESKTINSEENHTTENDSKIKEDDEETKLKALEDWFINDHEDDEEPNLPVYKNEAERKALEKLYEIQSTIDGNESFDLEKEKITLKRLLELKATNENDISVKSNKNIELNDISVKSDENSEINDISIEIVENSELKNKNDISVKIEENSETEFPLKIDENSETTNNENFPLKIKENSEPKTNENIKTLFEENPKTQKSFVKCDQCGKNIVDNDKAVQSHKDYHTALNVSRDQREEFRQELKNKILSPKQTPPAKKAKLDTTISSIKTFFAKPLDSEESSVDQQPCDECGRLIDVDKLAEHADYHFARKIQIEMNSNDIKMVSKNKKLQPKGKGKDFKSGPSVLTFFSQPSTSKSTIH
ncbi:POLH family protein [Megaselia abdita]